MIQNIKLRWPLIASITLVLLLSFNKNGVVIDYIYLKYWYILFFALMLYIYKATINKKIFCFIAIICISLHFFAYLFYKNKYFLVRSDINEPEISFNSIVAVSDKFPNDNYLKNGDLYPIIVIDETENNFYVRYALIGELIMVNSAKCCKMFSNLFILSQKKSNIDPFINEERLIFLYIKEIFDDKFVSFKRYAQPLKNEGN